MPVYRWVLPEDVAPVRRLVASVVAGGVDAVTFTSAPAAASLLAVADELGRRADLVAALNGRVLAIAVGAVTAGPLDAAGVPSRQPERARLGALAREVVARLPERDPVLQLGAHTLQVRGYAAVVDGRVVELAPGADGGAAGAGPPAGDVVPRPDLIASLPGGGDGHAVEMAVTRLRAALGAPVVETVVKRGYRLAPLRRTAPHSLEPAIRKGQIEGGPRSRSRGTAMTVLVAYTSRAGSTRGVAERIAARLQSHGREVHLDPLLGREEVYRFEAVVLGSPIYSGRVGDRGRRLPAPGTPAPWPVAPCGPSASAGWARTGSPTTPRAGQKSQHLAPAREHRFFAGVLDASDLKLIQRIAFRRRGGQSGDLRDWAAIDAWADEIARELSASPSIR